MLLHKARLEHCGRYLLKAVTFKQMASQEEVYWMLATAPMLADFSLIFSMLGAYTFYET